MCNLMLYRKEWKRAMFVVISCWPERHTNIPLWTRKFCKSILNFFHIIFFLRIVQIRSFTAACIPSWMILAIFQVLLSTVLAIQLNKPSKCKLIGYFLLDFDEVSSEASFSLHRIINKYFCSQLLQEAGQYKVAELSTELYSLDLGARFYQDCILFKVFLRHVSLTLSCNIMPIRFVVAQNYCIWDL